MIECISIGAVNIFIIISGYYLSQTNRRAIGKPVRLLFQVCLFSGAMYLLRVIAGKRVFSVIGIIEAVLPVNYYAILYSTLYLISPLLNLLIEKLAEANLLDKATMVLFALFSIWPTFVDVLIDLTGKDFAGLSTVGMYGSQHGYSIVNFILLYFIGATICRNKANHKALNCCLLCFSFLVIYIWSLFDRELSVQWYYSNPFVIILAAMIFELFRCLNLKQSRIIQNLAGASFTTFLMHTLFLLHIRIPDFVQGDTLIMLAHLFLSTVVIFAICYVIHTIYSFVSERVFKVIEVKLPFLQKGFFRKNKQEECK